MTDGRFTEGAALVTRTDFERAAEARAELLAGPAPHSARARSPAPTHPATLSSADRKTWEAALTLVAQELAATPRPLVLDGATWRASCRTGRPCGRCEVCEWDRQTDRLARPPAEDPRRVRQSVDGWFDAWVAYREDPHGAKSSLGIQLDRMSDGLSHGGSFVAREPSAVRAATVFVDVGEAFFEAARGAPGEQHVLSAEVVLDGLRALVVGLGRRSKKRGVTREPVPLEEVAVRWSDASEGAGGERLTTRAAGALVRRWRKRAAVELGARGFVGVRQTDADAVSQVRERLTKGRVTG